jgi:hypothetical protein
LHNVWYRHDVGFWRDFLLGPSPVTTSIVTPWSPQDSLQTFVLSEALGVELKSAATVTRDTALKIPAVKRSHDIVCGVFARMPWVQYDGAQPLAAQPAWLTTSNTGVSPRNLRWGVASDLFMTGWAVVGFELGADDLPADALHIPAGWWNVEPDGRITVDERIATRYTQRLAAISVGYGSSGMLIDGHDTIQQARLVEAAYGDRIENPIAQTDLTIAADRWDGWSKTEREDFRRLWIAGRSAAGGSVALKPDFVQANYSGAIPTDLFESGRNAVRLDIANHAGIPASLLEGSKHGGSSGEMSYSNETDRRNELWDFGLAKYADAAEARLSLDDVCAPGQSIRVDASRYLSVPTPTDPQTSED